MAPHRAIGASVASLCAGIALALATAIPASAATTFTVASHATLLAKGTAVSVDVTYVCAEGDISNVSFFLSQRAGRSIVSSGSGNGFVPCTGETQTATLILIGSEPFRPGEAVYTAVVNVYDPQFFDQSSETEQGVIRIVNSRSN